MRMIVYAFLIWIIAMALVVIGGVVASQLISSAAAVS